MPFFLFDYLFGFSNMACSNSFSQLSAKKGAKLNVKHVRKGKSKCFTIHFLAEIKLISHYWYNKFYKIRCWYLFLIHHENFTGLIFANRTLAYCMEGCQPLRRVREAVGGGSSSSCRFWISWHAFNVPQVWRRISHIVTSISHPIVSPLIALVERAG